MEQTSGDQAQDGHFFLVLPLDLWPGQVICLFEPWFLFVCTVVFKPRGCPRLNGVSSDGLMAGPAQISARRKGEEGPPPALLLSGVEPLRQVRLQVFQFLLLRKMTLTKAAPCQGETERPGTCLAHWYNT